MSETGASAPVRGADLLRPFRLERSALRGRLVRLGPAVDAVLGRHAYPDAVSNQLGQLLVLAATLAGALKFEGTFSLQIRSDGPISLMLADCTNDGALRGYARFDGAALASAEPTVPGLFGQGRLALTVQQAETASSYQGVVELAGLSLTDCLHSYFRQSEQLQTGLRIGVERVGTNGAARWRAGAIMVQRMPPGAGSRELPATSDEDWRRTILLLSTATTAELTDPALPLDNLLFRLFHEEGVRVFQPLPLSFGCRCSRPRVETMLRTFGPDDIDEMRLDDGAILVTCEFCSAEYRFEAVEVDRLLAAKLH